jgi:queuine tRNA-ribosyltransferase
VPAAAFGTRGRAARRRAHVDVGRARTRGQHQRTDQALFGIVQGGIDEALRAESAQRTVALDFDGYGIGGLSVGETRHEMLPALAAALAHLPADRPRYLMGVGDPASLVEAVGLGVDQFDCVMQTRIGRHGTALTGEGKLHVKNASTPWTTAHSMPPAVARCAPATAVGTSATCSRWASRPRRDW